MQLVVLDTETGGLDCRVHSLLSVGMWTIDTVKREVKNPLTFLVKEPNIVTTPGAMHINGIKIEDIERDGLEPLQALQAINNYCKEIGPKPMPVGHNIGFDIGFLSRLLSYRDSKSALSLPFHYRTIDVPSVLYTMYLTGILPTDISSSQKALKYFGMDRGDIHNALDDAECTGKVYLGALALLSKKV